MAKVVLGRVRPVMSGEYDASRAYEVLERVSHNGRVYECQKNAAAGIGPDEVDYWLLVSDGIDLGDELQNPDSPLNTAIAGQVETAIGGNIDAKITEIVQGKIDSGDLNVSIPDLKVLTTVVYYHVGGANEADDDDSERGTEAKPFATFKKAWQAINLTISHDMPIGIILHKDCDAENIGMQTLMSRKRISIMSDDITRTISGNGYYFCVRELNIQNVNIVCAYGIVVYDYTGSSHLTIGSNTTLTTDNGAINSSGVLIVQGTNSSCRLWEDVTNPSSDIVLDGGPGGAVVTVKDGALLSIMNYGHIIMRNSAAASRTLPIIKVTTGGMVLHEAGGDVQGSAVGKRYEVSMGGLIYTGGRGDEYFPGSLPGTCDEYSIYC